MTKQNAGEYIAYPVVESMLTKESYGSGDLYRMGLFRSNANIHNCIRSMKLKCSIIGKRTPVFSRKDLLTYWKKYRCDAPIPKVEVHVELTPAEVNQLADMITYGQRFNPTFDKNDLFKNIVTNMKERGIGANSSTSPSFFIKH
jgi:hypothetical protein